MPNETMQEQEVPEPEVSLEYIALFGQCQTALEERDEARALAESLAEELAAMTSERDYLLAEQGRLEQVVQVFDELIQELEAGALHSAKD